MILFLSRHDLSLIAKGLGGILGVEDEEGNFSLDTVRIVKFVRNLAIIMNGLNSFPVAGNIESSVSSLRKRAC